MSDKPLREPMRLGTVTVELNRAPVEVSILVDGQQQSGAFIANRARRGICIADAMQQINVTADDALLLLAWLQEQESMLRAMLDEEAAAVERLQMQIEPGILSRPGLAERD